MDESLTDQDSFNDGTPFPVRVIGQTLLLEHTEEIRCNHCRIRNQPCLFYKWNQHCHECILLGRRGCSFTNFNVWMVNINHRDEQLRASGDPEALAHLAERNAARDYAFKQWNDASVNSTRFNHTIRTYELLANEVDNFFVLAVLLVLLVYIGASRSFIRVVRDRMHMLT
ncbi:hypothetical protein DFH06DRAFT_1351313 [Mycena polygramma]|nr:hypothetical protein DFH06DRAFT_1351313 [Mycena polygramma]